MPGSRDSTTSDDSLWHPIKEQKTKLISKYGDSLVKIPDLKEKDTVIQTDTHGDIETLIKNLVESGIMDKEGNYIKGSPEYVHVGDFLDKGPFPLESMELLFDLKQQAMEIGCGDKFHLIIGTHEKKVINNEKDGYLQTKSGSDGELTIGYHSVEFKDIREKLLKYCTEGKMIAAVYKNGSIITHAGISPKNIQKLKGELRKRILTLPDDKKEKLGLSDNTQSSQEQEIKIFLDTFFKNGTVLEKEKKDIIGPMIAQILNESLLDGTEKIKRGSISTLSRVPFLGGEWLAPVHTISRFTNYITKPIGGNLNLSGKSAAGITVTRDLEKIDASKKINLGGMLQIVGHMEGEDHIRQNDNIVLTDVGLGSGSKIQSILILTDDKFQSVEKTTENKSWKLSDIKEIEEKSVLREIITNMRKNITDMVDGGSAIEMNQVHDRILQQIACSFGDNSSHLQNLAKIDPKYNDGSKKRIKRLKNQHKNCEALFEQYWENKSEKTPDTDSLQNLVSDLKELLNSMQLSERAALSERLKPLKYQQPNSITPFPFKLPSFKLSSIKLSFPKLSSPKRPSSKKFNQIAVGSPSEKSYSEPLNEPGKSQTDSHPSRRTIH